MIPWYRKHDAKRSPNLLPPIHKNLPPMVASVSPTRGAITATDGLGKIRSGDIVSLDAHGRITVSKDDPIWYAMSTTHPGGMAMIRLGDVA